MPGRRARGSPPAQTRSTYSRRVVVEDGIRLTTPSGSAGNISRRFSLTPAISPWDSGQMVRECNRPVRACAVTGRASCRVDPVITAVPGRLPSRFSLALSASRMSGTRWYSSTHTGAAPPTTRLYLANVSALGVQS